MEDLGLYRGVEGIQLLSEGGGEGGCRVTFENLSVIPPRGVGVTTLEQLYGWGFSHSPPPADPTKEGPGR